MKIDIRWGDKKSVREIKWKSRAQRGGGETVLSGGTGRGHPATKANFLLRCTLSTIYHMM